MTLSAILRSPERAMRRDTTPASGLSRAAAVMGLSALLGRRNRHDNPASGR